MLRMGSLKKITCQLQRPAECQMFMESVILARQHVYLIWKVTFKRTAKCSHFTQAHVQTCSHWLSWKTNRFCRCVKISRIFFFVASPSLVIKESSKFANSCLICLLNSAVCWQHIAEETWIKMVIKQDDNIISKWVELLTDWLASLSDVSWKSNTLS